MVATTNDKNNNDCVTKIGKNSIGKITPTNKLLEKSGAGNRRNPPINPIKMDANAVFSFNLLL